MTHNIMVVIDMQIWGDNIITKEDAIEEAKRGIRNRIKENGIEYLINHCMEFKYGGTFVSACDIPNTEAHKLANKQCKEAMPRTCWDNVV